MSDYSGVSLYRVEIDAGQVNNLLSRLNDDQARKSIKAGIRKSALIIRKAAQDNLVTAVTKAEFPSAKGNTTFKPLKNEINLAVYRNASGARIDLLDKRKKDSRAYMLKWFESGTKERATKKGANRGSIKASSFFKSAVQSKKGEAESSLQENIINSIMKTVNKKT